VSQVPGPLPDSCGLRVALPVHPLTFRSIQHLEEQWNQAANPHSLLAGYHAALEALQPGPPSAATVARKWRLSAAACCRILWPLLDEAEEARRAVEASLIATDAEGKKISSLDGIPGKLNGGQSECRFEGGLPGTPLSIHVTARRTGRSGQIRLGFDMRKWHGQPLLYLAYFDQISAFFEGVPDCSAIDLNCLLLGNVLFKLRPPATEHPSTPAAKPSGPVCDSRPPRLSPEQTGASGGFREHGEPPATVGRAYKLMCRSCNRPARILAAVAGLVRMECPQGQMVTAMRGWAAASRHAACITPLGQVIRKVAPTRPPFPSNFLPYSRQGTPCSHLLPPAGGSLLSWRVR
jgi:hypothetical protein